MKTNYLFDLFDGQLMIMVASPLLPADKSELRCAFSFYIVFIYFIYKLVITHRWKCLNLQFWRILRKPTICTKSQFIDLTKFQPNLIDFLSYRYEPNTIDLAEQGELQWVRGYYLLLTFMIVIYLDPDMIIDIIFLLFYWI